jgi:hypothetical protein
LLELARDSGKPLTLRLAVSTSAVTPAGRRNCSIQY